MATNEKKKRKVIDINMKMDIINDRKNNLSCTELVKKYNLSASTISTIINEKNQEKIKNLTNNELIKPDCKRMKLPLYQKIDEAMDLWFKNTIKEKNITIDGTFIQEKYSNINIQYFPPNLTSIIQPLDQGIINSFKIKYRKQIVKEKLDCLEYGSIFEKIDILNAINKISNAWRDITRTTIMNCFYKAGFKVDTLLSTDFQVDDHKKR